MIIARRQEVDHEFPNPAGGRGWWRFKEIEDENVLIMCLETTDDVLLK